MDEERPPGAAHQAVLIAMNVVKYNVTNEEISQRRKGKVRIGTIVGDAVVIMGG